MGRCLFAATRLPLPVMKPSPTSSTWSFGPYRLDGEGQLSLGGGAIPLSPLQRRLLVSLLRHAGEVVGKETLLQEVWGHTSVSDVNLARAMHGLRRILDRGPLGGGVIRTIYGSGYSFDLAVRQHQAKPRAEGQAATGSAYPTGLALSHFIEGLVQVRHRDPLLLPLAADHFRHCLADQPAFAPARLQLAFSLLAHYRWGLSPASAIEGEVEECLAELEASGQLDQEVRALRVEALSLLAWQPAQVEERYGAWLPQQLSAGGPRHCWIWHLMATGRAALALERLVPDLRPEIPCGWMLAGMAELLLGRPEAAIDRLARPLELDGSLGGLRLLQALALAEADRATDSLAALEHSPRLESPAQAIQALVHCRAGQRAAALDLLQAALGAGQAEGQPPPPMVSLWGLVALSLEETTLAAQLLDRAVASRCGLAPLLLHWPGLSAHGATAAVQSFRCRMQAFTSFTAPA